MGRLTTMSMAQQYANTGDKRESKAGENSVKSQRSPRPRGFPIASRSRMKTALDTMAPLGTQPSQVYAGGVEREAAPARTSVRWELPRSDESGWPGNRASLLSSLMLYPPNWMQQDCPKRGYCLCLLFLSTLLHPGAGVSTPDVSITARLRRVSWMAGRGIPAQSLNLTSFPHIPFSAPLSILLFQKGSCYLPQLARTLILQHGHWRKILHVGKG